MLHCRWFRIIFSFKILVFNLKWSPRQQETNWNNVRWKPPSSLRSADRFHIVHFLFSNSQAALGISNVGYGGEQCLWSDLGWSWSDIIPIRWPFDSLGEANLLFSVKGIIPLKSMHLVLLPHTPKLPKHLKAQMVSRTGLSSNLSQRQLKLWAQGYQGALP